MADFYLAMRSDRLQGSDRTEANRVEWLRRISERRADTGPCGWVGAIPGFDLKQPLVDACAFDASCPPLESSRDSCRSVGSLLETLG